VRIEVGSFARDPARPDACEDAFVVLPGRAYAVIDGVSDRVGTRYDGMLSGRYAARLVATTLERLLVAAPPPVESIVPTLTATLAEAYRRHAMLDAATADWRLRLACALALVVTDGPQTHLVITGDSGIRLNGRRTIQYSMDLDRITATLRFHAWHAVENPDPAIRDAAARRITAHGTAQPPAPPFTAETHAAIQSAAEAECTAALPHIPRADILRLLRHGIVGAQGDYQNNAESVLGYPCLDGFPIPRHLFRIATIPTQGIETIELFSDGYFAHGATPGLAAWEAAHAEVEAEDPHKIARYRSTKGSLPGRWTDDRTYVCAQLT
jgi:hypothetical protein